MAAPGGWCWQMSGANVSGELMIQAAPGGEDTYMHTASFDGYIWWIHLVDTFGGYIYAHCII